jgi:hypothetical protein
MGEWSTRLWKHRGRSPSGAREGRGVLAGRAWLKLGYGAALLVCALGALIAGGREVSASPSAASEPPREWDGQPLRPLALGDVEQRFAARFPGTITRLSDGTRLVVLRDVRAPTRMLHPASDCYRGAGWRVGGERLEADARERRWRCFDAVRGGERLRVCERITDADGQAFTDPSSWFWAALLGRSHGPWQAVTTSVPL